MYVLFYTINHALFIVSVLSLVGLSDHLLFEMAVSQSPSNILDLYFPMLLIIVLIVLNLLVTLIYIYDLYVSFMFIYQDITILFTILPYTFFFTIKLLLRLANLLHHFIFNIVASLLKCALLDFKYICIYLMGKSCLGDSL